MRTNKELFASVPWSPYPSLTTPTVPKSYHKARVPYTPNANHLQYLDIWTLPLHSSQPSSPAASEIPSRPGKWIIYIHGGAWRDPLVQAESFNKTVDKLLDSSTDRREAIAGIASLNYSLSPHPNHPTLPSPPRDGSKADPARSAVHPVHIHDILTSLLFLQDLGAATEYILLGHSCGATLAFQALLPSGWVSASSSLDSALSPASQNTLDVVMPEAIVGLNGLYDLPLLISSPGAEHETLKGIYKDFTTRAFSPDTAIWSAVSPAHFLPSCAKSPNAEKGGDAGQKGWKTGQIVLVQSKEDKLVPYAQTEGMLAVARREFSQRSGDEKVSVRELEAGGDHNALWEDGGRLSEIIWDVLRFQY